MVVWHKTKNVTQMNRLVIIGNGFDMAHGLKTSYMDFINWYWERRLNAMLTEHAPISEMMSQGLVNGIKNNAQFLVLRMIGE